MRTRYAIISFFIALTAHAQNWALLNPAYKYNYSNNGSDTITDQVFVTHIDTLGVDSIRYELNEFARPCGTCDPTVYSTSCVWSGQQPILKTGIPHALGNDVVEGGLDWWITVMAGSMLIKPHAAVGTTWTSPLGGLASVYAMDTMTLFGVLDSVKLIAYSGGDSLLLTRSFGMAARWTDPTTPQELVGLDGDLQLGRHVPDAGDYFSHQIGDVLEFAKGGSHEDANCVYYTSGWIKYGCIQRLDLVDTIVLTYRTVEQMDETGFTIPGPPEPCGGGHFSWVDTVAVRIAKGAMMSVHHFNPDLRIGTWPGAFGSSDYLNPSDSMRTWMIVGVDSTGRTTLGTAFDVSLNSNLFCPSDQDSSILLQAQTNWWLSSTFAEGLGLVDEVRGSIIGGSGRHLVGHIINGDTTGVIHSDSYLLSTSDVLHRKTSIDLAPNPASDHLTLLGNNNLGGSWRITATTGQFLSTGVIQQGSPPVIDVSSLLEGMYLLNVTTAQGSSSQRFVIAR